MPASRAARLMGRTHASAPGGSAPTQLPFDPVSNGGGSVCETAAAGLTSPEADGPFVDEWSVSCTEPSEGGPGETKGASTTGRVHRGRVDQDAVTGERPPFDHGRTTGGRPGGVKQPCRLVHDRLLGPLQCLAEAGCALGPLRTA